MQVQHTVAGFRQACDQLRAGGKRLALVPTMGALHAGHLALVAEARRRADHVCVTIFVNPTQFAPNEDFEKYPRTFQEDERACEAAGVTLIFAPAAEEMYPPGECTRVRVERISSALCGHSRPGHFEGVATVVAKLFAAAGPCIAVFGRKDYQQLRLVDRLARDLLLPVEVVGHPTVRERDGLALSSRNAYLTADQRASALAIPRALAEAVRRFDRGARAAERLTQAVRQQLEQAGLRVDYVELADADTVEPLAPNMKLAERALLAVAAFAGKTRLIDNVVLGEDPPPAADGGA